MSVDLFKSFIVRRNTPVNATVRIRTLTSMDDDWKITSNGTILSDPQVISPSQNRDMTFTGIPAGSNIKMYLYDGTPAVYTNYKWEATITWPDTTVNRLTGGSTFSDSTTASPIYYENGWFTVAKQQPEQPWPYSTAYQLITSAKLAIRDADYTQWDIVYDNTSSLPLGAEMKICKGCFRFVMYDMYTKQYQVLGASEGVIKTSLPLSGYFNIASEYFDFAPVIGRSFKVVGIKFYGQNPLPTSNLLNTFVGTTDYYKILVKRLF